MILFLNSRWTIVFKLQFKLKMTNISFKKATSIKQMGLHFFGRVIIISGFSLNLSSITKYSYKKKFEIF